MYIAVIISSPVDVNATLGSTVTFTCTVENAFYIVWSVNGSLNAEHSPFNGDIVSQKEGTELVEEIQLEATLLLNNSEVSCTAGNLQAELLSSSSAKVLVQGIAHIYSMMLQVFIYYTDCFQQVHWQLLEGYLLVK